MLSHKTKEETMNEVKVLEMLTDEVGVTGCGDAEFCLWGNEGDSWEMQNLKPNARYACVMVPIAEGYRLMTEDELASDDLKIDQNQYVEKTLYLKKLDSAPEEKLDDLKGKLDDFDKLAGEIRQQLKEIRDGIAKL